MEEGNEVIKKEFINVIDILVSIPKYISDMKNNKANDDYLNKVHAILKNFLDKGYKKKQMLTDLENYMLDLRKKKKDTEEDLVLEAISFLVGECSSEWSLENYGE